MGDGADQRERAAEGTGATPENRSIYSVYQPMVSLDSGAIVAYEALARGSDGATPAWLYADAQHNGRLAELDWMCRGAAFSGALSAGMPREIPLFVNVDPASTRTPCPTPLRPVMDEAAQRLQLVMDVSERSLTDDPVGLLAACVAHRGAGRRIALDDTGGVIGGQSMMSLLRPDVIKLDRELVQGRRTGEELSVVDAAVSEAERTGAIIVAEGIETAAHLAIARSMGATVGQGWLFGRPGPLPDRFPQAGPDLPRLRRPEPAADTPFDVVRARRAAPARVDKDLLVRLSREFEERGVHAPDATVVLGTFQHGRNFTGAARHRYGTLARRGMLTAVFGVDLPDDLAPYLHGRDLSPADPLASDWTVIVVGNHFASGLFAREVGSPAGPDRSEDRRFDLLVTFDRDLILSAAEPLLRRLQAPAR